MAAVVGVYARVEAGQRGRVLEALAGMTGVMPFDLEDPGQLGIVVEAGSLEAAHRVVTCELARVSGLLGCWPVYAHEEGNGEDGGR